jgi:hypothetical protein
MNNNVAIPISAHLLSPFYYHGLYAMDGSATHPGVITDTALIFAVRHTLLGSPSTLPNRPNYYEDMRHIPWRASLLMGTSNNQVLPPVRHTIDVSREGGYHDKMQNCMSSGNFIGTFFVHEVASGAEYQGMLYGPDFFKFYDIQTLIVRVGVGGLGMLEIRRDKSVGDVHLNAKTASWFNRSIQEKYRILDSIRVAQAMSIRQAVDELRYWG